MDFSMLLARSQVCRTSGNFYIYIYIKNAYIYLEWCTSDWLSVLLFESA